MAHGEFIWCDLSAYDLTGAETFYADLFGWAFHRTTQPDGDPYAVASVDGAARAGMYEMPAPFRNMDLPSFWMSYIAVDDADAVTATAGELGGRVEFGPAPDGQGGRVALIRDPLGAGFTIRAGGRDVPRGADPQHGEMAWNALHVSEADAIVPFYESLFGWRMQAPDAPDLPWTITDRSDLEISAIHETGASARGGIEFWAVTFAVMDLDAALDILRTAGGEVVDETVDGGLRRADVCDPWGAALSLIAVMKD